MLTFNNLNDLIKHVKNQAASTMMNEVAAVVKEQMHEVIEDITYEQYTPTEYIRTHDLSDIANMEVTMINDNTIQVVNTSHDGDRDVAQIVASGIGYEWINSAIYRAQPFPRDFYEDTLNFLEHYGKHIEAFKEGMAKRGINIV